MDEDRDLHAKFILNARRRLTVWSSEEVIAEKQKDVKPNSFATNDDDIAYSSFYSHLQNIKVLLIGAGGIGCELLKCLVLVGVQHLTVIDLDSIDISNLNRQFLFRREHVGMSKALVAAEAVRKFNPRAEVKGFCGNVKNPQFGGEFMRGFDVILNALDNQDARRHVNRICVAYDIPLLESGSMGCNGQTYLIRRGATMCYDCSPPAKTKSYAVCTIRSSPEKPEHCVAWAKYLFELLFGLEDEGNLLLDLKKELLRPGEEEEKQTEGSEMDGTRAGTELAKKAFDFLFNSEVRKAADMKDANKVNKVMPRCLSLKGAENDNSPQMSSVQSASVKSATAIRQQKIWTISECTAKFLESIQRMYTERPESLKSSSFDKDDEIAMDFVAAAANLRMHNYHIQLQSRWDIQSIAGAIVPAIATTNAMVASMQVVQLVHWLDFLRDCRRKSVGEVPQSEELATALQKNTRLRFVWIRQIPLALRGDVIATEQLDSPSPKCYVCQQQQLHLTLHSFEDWTLRQVVTKVFKGRMGTNQPIVDFEGKCLWDPDDAEEDSDFIAMTNRSIAKLGISAGSYMIVTDTSQGDFQCDVIFNEDTSMNEEKEPDLFALSSLREKNDIESAQKRRVVEAESSAISRGKKRKASDVSDGLEEEEAPPLKKVLDTTAAAATSHVCVASK